MSLSVVIIQAVLPPVPGVLRSPCALPIVEGLTAPLFHHTATSIVGPDAEIISSYMATQVHTNFLCTLHRATSTLKLCRLLQRQALLQLSPTLVELEHSVHAVHDVLLPEVCRSVSCTWVEVQSWHAAQQEAAEG